jgi:hypothetical protein
MGLIVDASSMLMYLGALLVAFSGIYFGAVLGFMAYKEIKPGRHYLMGLENTLLIFIILMVLNAYGAPILLLALLGVALAVFLFMTTANTPVNQIAYFLLGIAFYFSTKTTELFVMTAILIFLYGLPLGSLYVARHEKQSKGVILSDILLKYFFFILAAIITHFIASKFGGV